MLWHDRYIRKDEILANRNRRGHASEKVHTPPRPGADSSAGRGTCGDTLGRRSARVGPEGGAIEHQGRLLGDRLALPGGGGSGARGAVAALSPASASRSRSVSSLPFSKPSRVSAARMRTRPSAQSCCRRARQPRCCRPRCRRPRRPGLPSPLHSSARFSTMRALCPPCTALGEICRRSDCRQSAPQCDRTTG